MSLTINDDDGTEVKTLVNEYNQSINIANTFQDMQISFANHLKILGAPLRCLISLDSKENTGKKKIWRDSHQQEILNEFEKIRDFTIAIKNKLEDSINTKQMSRLDTIIQMCAQIIKSKERIIIPIPPLPVPFPVPDPDPVPVPVPDPGLNSGEEGCCRRFCRFLGFC